MFYGIHISKITLLEVIMKVFHQNIFMLDLPIAEEKTLEKCLKNMQKMKF